MMTLSVVSPAPGRTGAGEAFVAPFHSGSDTTYNVMEDLMEITLALREHNIDVACVSYRKYVLCSVLLEG